MRGQVLLTKLVGGREGERGRTTIERGEKEEEESFRERNSHFFLDFPTIGPSNPSETRGKVYPHCKSYAWVPVLWSFGNSGRYGSSSTWIFFVPKAIKMVLGVVRSEMTMDFGSKKWNRYLMRGVVLGQPMDWLGTIKNSPDLLVGPKLSM